MIQIQRLKPLKQVFKAVVYLFSVALVHFSNQKLNSQPPHYLVTCSAHHKRSFSFFGTFMQLIMYSCVRFPTLSVANVMLLKMYSVQ